MIPQPLKALLGVTLSSVDLNQGRVSGQYETTIMAIMKSRPGLSRTSAIRLVNELLEIADEKGQ